MGLHGMRARLSFIFIIVNFILSLPLSANQCGSPEAYLQTVMTTTNPDTSCLSQLKQEDMAKLINLVVSKNRNTGMFNSDVQLNYAAMYPAMINELVERYMKNKNDKVLFDNIRVLMEEARAVELQNYFDDDCLPPRGQLIEPEHNEAILYIHIDNANKPLLLLSTSDDHEIIEVPTKDIVRLAQQFISLLSIENMDEERNTSHFSDLKKVGSDLYDLLLRPIESKLDQRGIETLVVVPDVKMGIIPFEAFWDKQQDKYVVQKEYDISYLSNLTGQYDTKNSVNRRVMFAPLTNDRIEESVEIEKKIVANSVSALYEITGSSFSKSGLLHTLNNQEFSIFHIASHAKFEGDFEKSYIQLGDNEQLKVRDFEQMIRSASTRMRSPELIVLSACETAVGTSERVESSFGLAGVAARSGAKSVIASLWNLRFPTALIGPEPGDEQGYLNPGEYFYKLISKNKGFTKAEALHRAKANMVLNNESIRDWAALVLIGDWHEMGR